mgnify:FL=1
MEKNKLSELRPFLDEQGRLTAIPAKHRKKLLALWYLAGKIEAGRQYTEPEINDLLDEWALPRDHASLRRELYNNRLLNRTADCSRYWRAESIPPLAEFIRSHV